MVHFARLDKMGCSSSAFFGCQPGRYLDTGRALTSVLHRPGTKDALQRGERRYNALLEAHSRKPAIPLRGLTGYGFAVSDPFGRLEALHGHDWARFFHDQGGFMVCKL